ATETFVTANAAGGGGGGGAVALPIVPVAERAFGALIVQLYDAFLAGAFQVQSTSVPLPDPCATVVPLLFATVTVHALAADSRAWKRIGPPSTPATVGP